MSRIKKGKKEKGVFCRTLRALILVCALGAALFVMFLAVRVFSLDSWHDFDPDRITGAAQTLIVYDVYGNEAERLHSLEDRIPVELDEVPYLARMAFVSAEDARFYDHIGVDFIRIAGALWADIKAGGYVQGASTISQQLIKLSHLTSEKTISRKLEEAVLACQMEQRYSKDEILNMYLNYVYFGGGYYGIEAASRGYFGTGASELTVPQAAMLAGILKSPSNYAPHIDMQASVGRRNLILGLMCEYGYISQAEKEKYVKDVPVIVHDGSGAAMRSYYSDAATDEAKAILGIEREELLTGGYRVYTFMEPELQDFCEELYENDGFFPGDGVQSALVLLRTNGGGAAAIVGGRDDVQGFNRATDIRRQPGSLIKPIIAYAPAIERGYTAASILVDEPTDFAGYAPANFNDKYYGTVTLREAVTRSLNIPAVTVLSEIGVDAGMEFAKDIGIVFEENDRSLALALGGFTYGVSPMQMAGAYAAFASGGEYSTPAVVQRITDSDGKLLYEYAPEKRRIMSEAGAFILTDMLKNVVSSGTGRRLGELGIPLAGKTGTAGGDDHNTDAWMAAYSPNYAAVVWMGYDTAREGQYLENGSTGGSYPALILNELYKRLYTGKPAPDFKVPEGVITCRLDSRSLNSFHMAALANALTPLNSVQTEYFIKGTQPVQETAYWAVPRGVRNLEVALNSDGLPEVRFTAVSSNAKYVLYRQDMYGNIMEMRTFFGAGRFSHADDAAEYTKVYTYWVQPVHMELNINGKRVTGPESQRAAISVGDAPNRIDKDIDFTVNN